MSTEPLWRGPTRDIHPGPANLSDIDISIKVPPGTEVEVWPAGDRTPVTREQVRDVLRDHMKFADPIDFNRLLDGLWALLSGVPTEDTP